MTAWTVPVRAGWKLRVLSGTSLGKEFDLPLSRYTLGSQAPAGIVIPDPSIAPQHLAIDLHADHVVLSDCSGGRGVLVNGRPFHSGRLEAGDEVTIGTFKFLFTNPAAPSRAPALPGGRLAQLFNRWPLWQRAGAVSGVVAGVLTLLLIGTHTPTLVPVTLIAVSAVVPATVICYLIEKYDRTGISFHSLVLTFLAGGTIGIISTMLGGLVAGALTGGLVLLPVFAGVLEEPAKFLGTAWRWRHPKYDRPMDGLILGTVAGFGFAVFETAGYGFIALETSGLDRMIHVLLLRSLTAPFGHGLWSGILAAAFWQCQRDFRRCMRSKTFGIALAWAVGLHALWNLSASLPGGWAFTLLSGSLSLWQYRLLLAKQGYRV